MTRRTQPVELGPPAPPDAPSLPVLCDDVARTARSLASRLDRAARDLAGDEGIALGHQDVWRFEADARRAARDLVTLADTVAAWRRDRDAEVAAAT